MALNRYGVLKGRAVGFEAERRGGDATPHFHVFLEADGRRFDASVNVKSRASPSELVFHQALRFEHPVTRGLAESASGFRELARTPQGGGLDYIRGNLFDLAGVVALPHDAPGREDDLSDFLESQTRRAIDDRTGRALAFVFGEPFPSGIHNVHMNQGNAPPFTGDNGVWQDGGLLFHHPDEGRWVALFLAFQSQALHTRDDTGAALPGSRTFRDVVEGRPPEGGTEPGRDGEIVSRDGLVRIVGALVNPEGPEDRPDHAGRPESVTLLNTAPHPIDLTGWAVANASKAKFRIDGVALGPGGAARVDLDRAVPLGNKGGLISLLDPLGTRVDGVSYTQDQARREGWTLAF